MNNPDTGQWFYSAPVNPTSTGERSATLVCPAGFNLIGMRTVNCSDNVRWPRLELRPRCGELRPCCSAITDAIFTFKYCSSRLSHSPHFLFPSVSVSFSLNFWLSFSPSLSSFPGVTSLSFTLKHFLSLS